MSKTSPSLPQGLKAQPPYPWLGQAWATFTQQVEDRRLPHAILLVGPNGVGCVDLAHAMAQYLLCVSPQNQQSCGHCKSCYLMQVDGHPDLHVITLEENEKTKKLSQNIKIQQIREVNQSTANTSQQGGRKVIVIHPAEAMNVNAANALLKSLEEPNGDCTYLLVSEQAALLMATIRSRCSRLVIASPPFNEAVLWLERNKIADAEKRLRDVGGRPLRVIEWLEKDIWGQREQLSEQILALLRGDSSFLECAKAISSHGPLWLIEQVQGWLCEAIARVDAIEPDKLGEILRSQPPFRLFKLYDCLIDKKKLVLSTANPNPQLIIEEILMQMQELGRSSR